MDFKRVIIKVEDIYKSFGKHQVLKGVSFEIMEGETFTVMGRSGVGKSVLLKILVGLLHPDRGKIYFYDEDITHASEDRWKEIRKNLAVVFQQSALFDSMTVEENVAFGLRRMYRLREDEIRERVNRCLALVGLPGINNKMPSELSGGMKKRVALARAIALEPKIIFYDEPTTGLDPVMADVISNLIIKMQQELRVTSFIITHELKLAYKVSDRIAMLYDGKIIEMGTPEQIRSSSNPVVKQFIEGRAEGPMKIVEEV